MTEKKTIYLVRHGETEFNRLGIVQGSGVDSDLNEKGLEQAKLFYKYYQNHPFDHVYTSALKRTFQSVEFFIKKPLPHTSLAELNEISWGEYEGVKSRAEWKQDYIDMINAWGSGNLEYRIPGGENPLEMQARQKIALRHILNEPTHKNILVCMHGRALKSFLCLMMNKPLQEMEDFQHYNLCLYVLEYEKGLFKLIENNSIEHLNEILF